MPDTLVVFGRLPVPGRVKTRLAAGIGVEAACTFYRACCEHVLLQTAGLEGTQRMFCYSDQAERDPVTTWIGELDQSVEVAAQAQDPDLGARMAAALQSALSQGATKAVIVGTDIPDLSAEVIRSAFCALEEHDVVLGPAADGGYYLLGLKSVHPTLFEGMCWSTNRVLEETTTRAILAGLNMTSSKCLPTLRDIDTEFDLHEWAQGASETHTLYDLVHRMLLSAGNPG